MLEVLAFLLTLIGIPAFIDFIEKHRLQVSLDARGCQQQQAKAGTPTMSLVFLIVE